MSLIRDECIEFNEVRKICVAFEKGKKYQLNNNSDHQIKKVKVDKCVLKEAVTKKCDYLMSIDSIKRVIFIELKGGDLSHAVKQLYSAIDVFKGEFINYQIDARIVGSRDVPGFINTADYLKLERKIHQFEGEIKRSTNNIYTEYI